MICRERDFNTRKSKNFKIKTKAMFGKREKINWKKRQINEREKEIRYHVQIEV